MRAISAKSLALAPYLRIQLSARANPIEEMRRNILLHVLPSRIAEHLCCPRCIRPSSCLYHHLSRCPNRIFSVFIERLQTSRKHLLKAHNHHAVCHSMLDHVPRHMQACRAGGAVIVDIVDWDLRHAELIEYPLAAGRVAIAVAGDSLVDIVVVDLGVQEGLDAGFKPELGVVDCTETQRGRDERESGLPLPRGLMNLVRPTPRT